MLKAVPGTGYAYIIMYRISAHAQTYDTVYIMVTNPQRHYISYRELLCISAANRALIANFLLFLHFYINLYASEICRGTRNSPECKESETMDDANLTG